MLIRATVDSSRARRRMQDYRRRADTLPWQGVGEIARAGIKATFILGGYPSKWTPRKVDRPWPILRKSDRLMNEHYIELVPNGVAVGNRVPYQATHNFGDMSRGISKREYLFVKKEDIVIISELLRRHLVLSSV